MKPIQALRTGGIARFCRQEAFDAKRRGKQKARRSGLSGQTALTRGRLQLPSSSEGGVSFGQ